MLEVMDSMKGRISLACSLNLSSDDTSQGPYLDSKG